MMRRLMIVALLAAAACQTTVREVPKGRIETDTHPDYAQIRPVAIALLPVEAPAYGLKRATRREAYQLLFERRYSPFKLEVVDAHIRPGGAFDGGSLDWDATLDINVDSWRVVPGTQHFASAGRATLRHRTGEVVWSCKFEDYGVEVPAHAGESDQDAAARAIARMIVERMPERPPLPPE